MGNLGGYQLMTTVAKKVGGPKMLALLTAGAGYVIVRLGEGGLKKGIGVLRARGAPCATKGQVFRAFADGEEGDLSLRVGDEYRVLECDGDAILIEVLDDPNNPYFVSSRLLRLISDFPQTDTKRANGS